MGLEHGVSCFKGSKIDFICSSPGPVKSKNNPGTIRNNKQSPPVMAEKIFFMWRKGNPKYIYQLFNGHAKIRVYCLHEQKPLFT
jgi:hypothetical protein